MHLIEPEEIDFEKYADQTGGGKSFAPPPEGKYKAKAPIIKDDGSLVLSDKNDFTTTQAGYLKVRIEPLEVVGVDYKIRFTSLSAKKYSNREGNQIMDYLRACGIPIRPKNNVEYRQAVKLTAGRTPEFGLVWEAYNKDTQESTKGMANFPDDPQTPGKKLHWIEDSNDTDEQGRPKRIWANGKVRYWVSAITKPQAGA